MGPREGVGMVKLQWAEYGVGPFMVRLAVEPGRDPDMAIVRLHALPGDRENLATYRGNPETLSQVL